MTKSSVPTAHKKAIKDYYAKRGFPVSSVRRELPGFLTINFKTSGPRGLVSSYLGPLGLHKVLEEQKKGT
jgi:hypothetical protein